MNICCISHTEVVYEGSVCPMCALLIEVGIITVQVNDKDDEISELRQELEDK